MRMTQDNLVEVRKLCYSRGSTPIFSGVDLDIKRGKVTAIMGPSGTGKTTLLRLIGRQIQPDAGTITVAGHDLSGLDHGQLYAMRKRMGMLFQQGALFTDLSVYENVAFPLREHTDLEESMIRDIVLLKLQAVGLRAVRDMLPHQLSGGMARRVALARAIALDPMLVIYDEPFTGQDPISMAVLVTLLRSLNDNLGLTSILVSHDVEESLSIADYVYVIAAGSVVAHGEPEALRASTSPWLQQFIQGRSDGPVPFHFPGPSLAVELFGGV